MATLTAPRPVRVAASIVGVAGMVVLAGCSAGADTAGTATQSTSDTGTAQTTAPTAAATDAATEAATGSTSGYADGTYTADGSYQTPRSVEEISVTLTLAGGTVTAVEVTGSPSQPESKQYQGQFIDGISAEVVGKSIDDLNVTRVSGSSLTSAGFNEAVATIKKEAAAG